MNELNTLSSTTTKMTRMLDKIAETCDALIGALEYTTEATSQYGGGIVQSFDSEYVDIIIRTLLLLRGYATRLGKEIKKGLIRSEGDLMLLVEGMQDLDDNLVELMRKNGNLRNNFAFGLEEIRSTIREIKDSVYIS